MATTEQILDYALDLPDDQRALIAERLIESLGTETFADNVAAAWRIEIGRRMEEVKAGTAHGRPWEEVREDLDRDLSHCHDSHCHDSVCSGE